MGNKIPAQVFLIILSLLGFTTCVFSAYQDGPDPWDYRVTKDNSITESHEGDLPLDFKSSSSKKVKEGLSDCTAEEWFFRRILAILVKGGQVKVEDDGSAHVSIQMKFPEKKWKTMQEYLKSNAGFTEEMYRRSIGYVEEAVYKPGLVETIVVTWTENILFFLEEYRMAITWLLGVSGAILASMLVWKRMSHHHIFLLLFLMIYFYEAFVSYKEAEQQEYNNFITALNACKWQFWTSTCAVSPPDPLIFLKHMHPLRIGMKIFTMLVSEPIFTISQTVKVMVDGVTDGLWFPFDKIVYIILIVVINLFLIMSLIMVLFNFILNIPFNLSFFAGLIHIGVKQRHRSFIPQPSVVASPTPSIEQGDRISGQNLDKLLSFCAQALSSSSKTKPVKSTELPRIKGRTIKKSASAGRLTDLVHNDPTFTASYRFKTHFKPEMGSGDS